MQKLSLLAHQRQRSIELWGRQPVGQGIWDPVLTSARDLGSWHLPGAGTQDGEKQTNRSVQRHVGGIIFLLEELIFLRRAKSTL